MEDELKELEVTTENEKEEHEALMKQKEKEYEETEQELTANNQEICAYRMRHTWALFIVSQQ